VQAKAAVRARAGLKALGGVAYKATLLNRQDYLRYSLNRVP
jgi:hypothetical protein